MSIYNTSFVLMFWIITIVFLWKHGFVGGTPYVAIVGGDAYLNWTINNLVDVYLFIRNPVNETMIVFYETMPSLVFDNRTTFTGNISRRIVSFTLSNVKLSDAGRYTFVMDKENITLILGGQVLIVAAAPTKPQIVEFKGHAVNGTSYHLNCSAQSNSQPLNHNLSMFSEWRKDDMLINLSGRYIVNGTELTITGVSYKQDNGSTLTCVAFENQLLKSENSDKFIMDVKYGPDNIQLNPSDGIITERENGKIVVNCAADCNPPCSFKWSKDLVPTPLSNNQTLIITSVNKSDTSRYVCNVSNSITGISMIASINVTIIYGPVSTQISPSEFPLKVEENATLNIACSADCYPDCNFTWNGPPNFFQMGAHLSRIVDRDKGGNYTCTATNQNNFDKKATVSVMVIVLYGPGNSVNLGSIFATVIVDLNQTAPDITCNATCNPPCDYRWYQNGIFFKNGAILSLGIVEKTTRGNYRCEAYTSVLGVNRSSSTSVNITVYYAPEVLLQPALLPRPSVYILKLGQTYIGLTCLVIDANPPVQRFIWTKEGHETQTQTSSTFTITMVTKDTMGRWGCKGVNSKGNSLESTLDVDVHYGPIITNMLSMTENEGSPINVSCIVDSRPDPSSITWTKSQNNTFTQNKAYMYIANLNRADKGTYECTAVNTIQPTGVTVGEIITVKSNYTLDVTFGAGIVKLSVNDNTVSENSSAIFQCQVDSNPPSNITWMKESNNAVLQTESGVVQSQYRIESAECLNMDNYTCSAYNGIRTPAKATIPLFVRCHPRTDYRFSHETKIYKRRYEAAVLRYTVISYPLPTFNWTFLGNGSESRYMNFSHNNGVQSELSFSSLGINDFGNYSVIADNSLPPSAREVFEIIRADVPEVPSNVTIVEITQTSMKVQWTAGNNGGLKQIFHVVVTADSQVRNVTADDPGYRENGTVFLDGLLPKTKYSIYMIASNSYGSSNMTEAIHITTLEAITPARTFPLHAVAGGIGAGVVVILMAVVALILWRRYHHRSQHTDDIKQDDKERPRSVSGLVDNPVYDSSGPIPGQSVNIGATGDEYAEVVKPKKKVFQVDDRSNIYAQVDKTTKNVKTGTEKGKRGKTSRGDIYENADLVRKRSTPDTLYQNSSNAKDEPCDENLYEDAAVTASNDPKKNKDGLLYADLMLDPPSRKNGKVVIRGIEDRVEYADIAYGKRGEPLPKSDHEK